MARKALIAREDKRQRLNQKFNTRRLELKEMIRKLGKEPSLNYDELQLAFRKLQALPLNASKVRQTTRCQVCGRSKAVYSKFGLCRICLRYFTMNGLISGIRKSSW